MSERHPETGVPSVEAFSYTSGGRVPSRDNLSDTAWTGRLEAGRKNAGVRGRCRNPGAVQPDAETRGVCLRGPRRRRGRRGEP